MQKERLEVAIDIGYGDVKIKYQDVELKFLNAISFAGNSSVNFGSSAVEVYNFADNDYLVGEDALLNTPFNTRNYKYMYEYAPILVYKSLKMLNIAADAEIKLITGLSLKDWDHATEFGKRLSNFFVNGEQYKCKVKVVPQGKGIYLDYKSSNSIDLDYFAICDIGYNTFDFLVFKDGKPVQNKNYANTYGVNRLVQEVQKTLEKDFKRNFSEQDVKGFILEKRIRMGNSFHDIADVIAKETTKYIKVLHNDIVSKNAEDIDKVFNVVISGGGAYFLNNINARLFDHQVYSIAPFEFANVRGYYKELVNE